MIPATERDHWRAIYTLFPLYDKKLCKSSDITLVLHGDLSGHLNVADTQVTSFADMRQLAQWLHRAVYDPTSVGVHCITELETIAMRVTLDDLEELLYAIVDRKETIEVYREDLGLVTIGYCADTGMWYADNTAGGSLSCEFSLNCVIDDVMEALSETTRCYAS